ncbi:MAG: 6,7-dimethyl-8-ribityllumazine synthase [Acidobacteriota bacterium]|jgi:6,7-dimethyl-8-ribityllumazine synthase|nr:MAG: 6,7-dimethyl-8-ribityllumazine synthase [Acidobacteriota bacterium]
MRIALIVSTYHSFVTDGLEQGAREYLASEGLAGDAVTRFPVPGAYELAQAASRVAATRRFDAIVCLGCLIRGETPHFDYIAQAASHGMLRAAQEHGVPVAFGLLTTNTADEAIARSVPGDANKGREAARAALEMARLYQDLEARP